eukprot:m.773102 g.773102  ORF g.773102 m.773102 type:complete len:149 (+) comp23248_c0_seq64:2410-2856(+)
MLFTSPMEASNADVGDSGRPFGSRIAIPGALPSRRGATAGGAFLPVVDGGGVVPANFDGDGGAGRSSGAWSCRGGGMLFGAACGGGAGGHVHIGVAAPAGVVIDGLARVSGTAAVTAGDDVDVFNAEGCATDGDARPTDPVCAFGVTG